MQKRKAIQGGAGRTGLAARLDLAAAELSHQLHASSRRRPVPSDTTVRRRLGAVQPALWLLLLLWGAFLVLHYWS